MTEPVNGVFLPQISNCLTRLTKTEPRRGKYVHSSEVQFARAVVVEGPYRKT